MLLSPQQILDIRGAIKLVTDTFMVSPVTYKRMGTSMDGFEEDRIGREMYRYELLGLVEYPTRSVQEETGWAIDKARIKITFSVDELYKVGRLNPLQVKIINDNNTHSLKDTEDYMIVNSTEYEVSYVMFDGPLEPKNVLLIVYGNIQEPRA